jgi:hypothetical protein
MFGLENEVTPQSEQPVTISYLMLSFMQIADQAKIIHWQTRYDREHRRFGSFYKAFIGQMDTVVEAIAGKYGKDHLKFGEAAIMVYDYDTSINEFFELVDDAFRVNFCEIFDKEKDSELFNLADEVLDLANKTKYLLQFEA